MIPSKFSSCIHQWAHLSPFIHQWALLFLPYQNLSHFRSLLDFFTELILYRNVTAQRKAYGLYLILTIFCLQNARFWAFLPLPIDRLRQGDVVSLVVQTDTFYLALLALAPMLMYYIHVPCFTMKPSFLRLLEGILFEDRNGVLQGVGYGNYSGRATSRFSILSLANLLQVFILATDAVLLILIYSLISTAIENPGELLGSPLDTPFTFIWNVLSMILGTWTTATSMALYGKVCINVAALGSGQLCVLFRRLYHSETLLAVYRQKNRFFSWVPFRQYLTYSGQTFQMIFIGNDIYGRLFLAFLLVNMPISAWAIVEVALGDLSQWSSIALGCMPAHELLVCILLHLAVAKFTKRLHASSKTLFRLNATTGHRVGNFRARLLLHHTIVRLHTNAQYGITYGSVGGLITMDSFGKCMLLYTELLMYAFKFICDI